MAHVSVVAALLLGVSYVVFRLLNRIVESHRRTAKIRELGCKEPPFERFRLPFGIDMIQAALRAEKAQLFLEWIQERTDKMGVNTCEFKMNAYLSTVYLLVHLMTVSLLALHCVAQC